MGDARSRPPVLVSKVHLEPGAAEAAAAAAARQVTTERLLVTAPTAPAVVAPAPAGPASAAGAATPPLPTARGDAALAPAATSAASAGTAAGHAAAAVQSAVVAAGGGESHSHGSWVQQLLDGLWPYARDAAQRMAWDTIPGTLEASRPPWVSGCMPQAFGELTGMDACSRDRGHITAGPCALHFRCKSSHWRSSRWGRRSPSFVTSGCTGAGRCESRLLCTACRRLQLPRNQPRCLLAAQERRWRVGRTDCGV